MSEMSDAKISAVIFSHNDGSFSRWYNFTLSKEDEETIAKIFKKYETDGESIRGTSKKS